MRKISTFVSSLLFVSSAAFAAESRLSFMPPNDLDKEDSFTAGGLTEEQFNSVIDKAEKVYGPVFAQFGATLTIERLWSDATVNAYADQSSATAWNVHMYGGLARRAEVTEDGFAMVICHELGHHLGGYPFVEDWAANEGQADMHATGVCATKLFGANMELSARAEIEVPADMKAKCDADRPEGERDVCYRALAAGKSLADLLAALGSDGAVNFNTPDTSVVTKTNDQHPAAQCRLDTYVAGALCGVNKWDYALIPGKNSAQHNSLEAQAEAFSHSCEAGDGKRPSCWFATLTEEPTPGGECPFGDQSICDLLCQFDPSQPWCSK